MFETMRDNVYVRFFGRAFVLAMKTAFVLALLTLALSSLACFGLAAYARADLPLPSPRDADALGGQLALLTLAVYIAAGLWPVSQIGAALCAGGRAFLRLLRKGMV